MTEQQRSGIPYRTVADPPPAVPPRRYGLMGFFDKIRPQIILAIFTLGLVSTVALLRDGEQYIAVVTGCTGGIIALGMKLLDGE
jgi:hypothetical protein|tara:strand:- start:323 stop:574 length:252 start_codon:yes stop_codon:yes gene_type:complete